MYCQKLYYRKKCDQKISETLRNCQNISDFFFPTTNGQYTCYSLGSHWSHFKKLTIEWQHTDNTLFFLSVFVRVNEPSEQRTFGTTDLRNNEPSEQRTFGTNEPSEQRTFGIWIGPRIYMYKNGELIRSKLILAQAEDD